MSIDEFYNNTYVYPEDWWYLASTAWPARCENPSCSERGRNGWSGLQLKISLDIIIYIDKLKFSSCG